MNELDALGLLGVVEPADPRVISAAALAVHDEARREVSEQLDAADEGAPSSARGRRRRVSRRVRIGVAVLGVASAAVAGVVIGIGSSALGPDLPKAFASWRATPTQPLPGQNAAADAQCVAAETHVASNSPRPGQYEGDWRAVLDDTRGTFTLVLMTAASTTSSDFGACLSDLSTPHAPSFLMASHPTPGHPLPGTIGDMAGGGSTALSVEIGQVGAGVTGVSFTLEDGTIVTSTVSGGLYGAWWPLPSQAPTSVTVTSLYGTVTERFPPSGTAVTQIPRGEIGATNSNGTAQPPGAPTSTPAPEPPSAGSTEQS